MIRLVFSLIYLCLVIPIYHYQYINISIKIFEKLSKYKDLEKEVSKMWHLKSTTLPVVTGALGMMAKIPIFRSAPTSRKFVHPTTGKVIPPVDSSPPNFYSPHQRSIPPQNK